MSKVTVDARDKGRLGCPFDIQNCQVYLHQLSALLWAKQNFTASEYDAMLEHFE